MKITDVTLHTRDLSAQRAFYGDVLGFPVASSSEEAVTFQTGWTRLTLRQDADLSGVYHFAFNVPENRFAQARAWLEERVALLADEAGEMTFHSDDWDADLAYFQDANGNIVEFIARHSLPTPAGTGFSVDDVSGVSELGLPVPGVSGAVLDLRERFELPLYGETSETFAPLGNEEGLLIVVPVGRGWFPTGTPAQSLPFHLRARTKSGVLELKEEP
ncbi:hypothetical protein [Deinococcus aluminii]|uniref:VOC domain-containing protein n=1 Tax=Deinococcus aluminii TaxID=1656885 RepID=A0ABP9XFV8_9DEIO